MTAFRPDIDASRAFRDALGQFATGVTVVTTQTERGPLGITANSFASVSLDPPLVLWSPARASKRFAAFEAASHYAIHILSDAQVHICERFTRDGLDFSGIDWSPSESGVPLLAGVLARFECTRHAAHDGGDHLIIVGNVQRVAKTDGAPLVFAQGGLRPLGPPG